MWSDYWRTWGPITGLEIYELCAQNARWQTSENTIKQGISDRALTRRPKTSQNLDTVFQTPSVKKKTGRVHGGPVTGLAFFWAVQVFHLGSFISFSLLFEFFFLFFLILLRCNAFFFLLYLFSSIFYTSSFSIVSLLVIFFSSSSLLVLLFLSCS